MSNTRATNVKPKISNCMNNFPEDFFGCSLASSDSNIGLSSGMSKQKLCLRNGREGIIKTKKKLTSRNLSNKSTKDRSNESEATALSKNSNPSEAKNGLRKIVARDTIRESINSSDSENCLELLKMNNLNKDLPWMADILQNSKLEGLREKMLAPHNEPNVYLKNDMFDAQNHLAGGILNNYYQNERVNWHNLSQTGAQRRLESERKDIITSKLTFMSKHYSQQPDPYKLKRGRSLVKSKSGVLLANGMKALQSNQNSDWHGDRTSRFNCTSGHEESTSKQEWKASSVPRRFRVVEKSEDRSSGANQSGHNNNVNFMQKYSKMLVNPKTGKQRSNSENRKRVFNPDCGKDEPQYFVNKLKCEFASSDLFFSQRKANQKSSKIKDDVGNPLLVQISLSEKKPKVQDTYPRFDSKPNVHGIFNNVDSLYQMNDNSMSEKCSRGDTEEFIHEFFKAYNLKLGKESEDGDTKDAFASISDNNYRITFFPKDKDIKSNVQNNHIRSNKSPRIVINKRNFVFKEAIDKINNQKSLQKNSIPIKKSRSSLDVNNCSSNSKLRRRLEATVPDFNPFEVAIENNLHVNSHKKPEIRSNSDVLTTNCFLSRVESNSETKSGRRSDIVHHDNPFSSTSKNLCNDFCQITSGFETSSKLSLDTGSNKESSANNEFSMLSNEMSNHSRTTAERNKKSIMLGKIQNELNDKTSRFHDECYNPFSQYDLSERIVEETDEE